MPAQMIGEDQEPTTDTIEKPEVVHLAMPKQLFDMLEWEEGDGIEWFFVDKERVLVKRVPKEEDKPEVSPVEVVVD